MENHAVEEAQFVACCIPQTISMIPFTVLILQVVIVQHACFLFILAPLSACEVLGTLEHNKSPPNNPIPYVYDVKS